MVEHIWKTFKDGRIYQAEEEQCVVCGVIQVIQVHQAKRNGVQEEIKRTLWVNNFAVSDIKPLCTPSIIHLAKKYQDAKSG